MPFTITRNDITKLNVDAIVNAANTSLQMGGGVCGAIFNAAGEDKLQEACDKLAPIKTGEAIITLGFNLPAKYIIHTAGPIYQDGKQGEELLLRSCYINSLELAVEHCCESIAFPLISSGIYGYPKAEAFQVATTVIRDFISDNDIEVSLVVFDTESVAISEKRHSEVESYLHENFAPDTKKLFLREESSGYEEAYHVPFSDIDMMDDGMPIVAEEMAIMKAAIPNIDDIVGNLEEAFSTALMRLIDKTGKKDAEIYHRANIDRRLFSKIRSNEHYSPSKPTVLAFAIALELTLEQTEDLLERAGFALSNSRKFDVIVEYFIQSRKYDIFEINEVLFSYDQPLLGG